ncbi:MAG: hypothetical protein LC798_13465 [Chloroflexi bacterium]|nr:hypothetical protein [Chloroflexota bacterium]
MAKVLNKITAIFGAAGKLEGTYGGGGVVSTSTDGILLSEPAELVEEWISDGARNPRAGGGGPARKGQPGGRGATVTLPIDAHGIGAGGPYTATVLVPDLHVPLRVSGLAAAFSLTPTPRWTFTPQQLSAAMASGVFDFWSGGELYHMVAAQSTMGFRIADAGYWHFDFPMFGVPDDPADASLPSITTSGVIPPAALDLALTIGAYDTAVLGAVRSIEFAMNREITPRTDHAAGYGHAGYAAGGREGALTVVIEATPLAPTSTPIAGGIDPYKMFREAVVVPIAFALPGAQNHAIAFAADYCQLSAWPARSDDGQARLWTLQFVCTQSTPGANDDFQLVFS